MSSAFDVQLDRGEGPSSPSLQAHVRIRPTTIRFTETDIPDVQLHLHSLVSLRPSPNSTLFDYDAETSPSDDVQLAEEVCDSLTAAGLVGDETVRSLTARLGEWMESVRGRRVRLIHSGRVLKDGVRVVGWLDEVERRRTQSVALEGQDLEDEEVEGVERRTMTIREFVEYLTTLSHPTGDGEATKSGAGKGKAREPVYYSTLVTVILRTAPVVYIQCSVGAPTTTPLIDTSSPSDDPTESARNRGFNRLLEAGLSPSEIASIRSQFRSTQTLPEYDALRADEHDAHLLELEESWMDGFHAPSSEPAEGSGVYTTLLQGLMVGFFAPPLAPLFAFRDKANPSSLGGLDAGEEGEGDDEQQWEQERVEQGQGVWSSAMQVSIVMGLVANVIMAVFRVVW
ncbi:protein of unknown function DUF2407 N-terminal [Kalmanozyma brasiliensis GHG001]|uniref:DSC E3 ubiquitin ligase complex subunit 3 C-terminal domain-containing protein n=1 Tax=Kalmanozyma brasiliensis (strain GHG001) TaxID=1365824 RepID=V5GHW0_KALBG|nr:protein of unknown function DUF2407 N-terminal [Kalmanozyma brasiliensis GHG001]EST05542.1 protein of unknown function DUF2407 N-terminal [Kalmanozyma brasiliensis GHG001]